MQKGLSDEAAEAAAKEAREEEEARRREEQDEAVKKKSVRYALNLKMALFGGFALIIPMLVMTLHKTEVTTFVTTEVFVLIVAVILAAAMDTAEPKDVVGATAAYAAVLVVFVGAGGGSDASGKQTSSTGSHKTHLSGGAIAGIVVGSLIGAIILILAFLCFWFGVSNIRRNTAAIMAGGAALFGLGRRGRHGEDFASYASDYYTSVSSYQGMRSTRRSDDLIEVIEEQSSIRPPRRAMRQNGSDDIVEVIEEGSSIVPPTSRHDRRNMSSDAGGARSIWKQVFGWPFQAQRRSDTIRDGASNEK